MISSITAAYSVQKCSKHFSHGNFNMQWKRKVILGTLPSIASECIKTLGYLLPQQIGWLFQFGSSYFFLVVYVTFSKGNEIYFK